MKQRLFIICQHLAPHILLSKMAGGIANCKTPFFKNFLIKTFIKIYKVNLSTAIYSDPTQYSSFNDFFTRKLKSSAITIDNAHNALVSPAEGVIYQYGDIDNQMLLQAKNHYFSLTDLLANHRTLTQCFKNKKFISIYLAPQHYHRIHMPYAGKLLKMVYVPGKLFSVNPITVANIPNLFAQNERVICFFETARGKMCVILVGAMLVGRLFTDWHGPIRRTKSVKEWDYSQSTIYLQKGDELGYFAMGSTVIVLFEDSNLQWSPFIQINKELKLGEAISRS